MGTSLSKHKDHHAFDKLSTVHIDSLDVDVEHYRHRVTGADHFHIASSHQEQVFMVAFRTCPTDSTGVAHVLEHTALCGSKRYPLRDPFFMMTRRSLNTFMNAMTSSDWTAYPFASQNDQDFDHLLDVYLDAVFFPRLHRLDFQQEGHRLTWKTDDKGKRYLDRDGVVFNEMKGAMSSITSQLWHRMTHYLYPDTTYRHNSGGDPAHIPDLTHEQLRAFHAEHYHPSNATFFTFGHRPAFVIQDQIEEKALKNWQNPSENRIVYPPQKRLSAPIEIVDHYPNPATQDQTHALWAWMLGPSSDIHAQLRASLLSDVLLGSSASPIMHFLERTSLAKSPSPLLGLSNDQREMCWIIGVEGTQSEHIATLEKQLFEQLQRVAKDGVDQDLIEASLQQMALSQREITGGRYPYGLELIMAMMPGVIYRAKDPISMLAIDQPLEQLALEARQENWVQQTVTSLILENQHRLRLVLKPHTKLRQQQNQQARDLLDSLQESLSSEEQSQIERDNADLAQWQASEQDESLLPKVTIKDIPASMSWVQPSAIAQGCHQYQAATNGLVYEQWIMPVESLSSSEQKYLPHLLSVIGQLGAGEYDYRSLQQRISRYTGGLSASWAMAKHRDSQSYEAIFKLSSKALVNQYAAMTSLLKDVSTSQRFDELDYLREIMTQDRLDASNRITGNGHAFAMLAASAFHSPLACLQHTQSGLQGIKSLIMLDDRLDDPDVLGQLSKDLSTLYQRIMRQSPHKLYIGQQLQEIDQTGVDSHRLSWSMQDLEQPQRHVIWTIDADVNYCAQAYSAVPMEHPDAPVLAVLAPIFRNGFLHTQLREQGGAYGGGASYSSDSQTFRFYSYRDPQSQASLDAFRASIDWLLANRWSDALIEQAILNVIASIDKPQSPSGHAKQCFYQTYWGYEHSHFDAYRQAVIAVSRQDLIDCAKRYLTVEPSTALLLSTSALKSFKQADDYQQYSLLASDPSTVQMA